MRRLKASVGILLSLLTMIGGWLCVPVTAGAAETPYVNGDADADGSLTVRDVTAIQKHIAEIKPLTGSGLVSADADLSGTVTVDDMTLLQMYLAELDVTLVQPKPSPPTANKKMLIFGDSITETASMNDDGTDYLEGTRTNWLTFAQSMLQTSRFKNYAKNGATYRDDPGRRSYRQWVSQQIELAAADSGNDDAEIIVLSLGTNDGAANDTYEAAMAVSERSDLDRTQLHQAIRYAMWTLRDRYPAAKCFVATPIQRALKEQPASLRNAIISMGRTYGFTVIDAESESGIVRENEALGRPGQYLTDGLHPNIAGAQKMAALYASEIIKAYSR